MPTGNRYRVAVMLLIRCTHKVLKLFGEKPRQVSLSGSEASLGEWYIHIADEFDGVFFVCMNARSLYTLILDVDGLRTIGDLAGRMLERLFLHMVELGIEPSCTRKVAEDYSQVIFAKTASRSLLGTMNDLINNLYFLTGKQMREIGRLDLRAIEKSLNNMPQRPIGWKYAQDRLIELYSQMCVGDVESS